MIRTQIPVPELTEDEDTETLMALAGLATRLAEAFCEYQGRCDYGFTERFAQMPSGCVGYYERDTIDFVAALVAGVEAGRVDYDPDAIDECLSDVSEAPCGAEVDFLCRDAVDGIVPPGGECESYFECEGQASCQEAANECPGVCELPVDPGPTPEPTQEEGMPCGGDLGECLPGLACFSRQIYTNPGAPVITISECVTPLEENEVCPQTSGIGAYPCVDGLNCAADDGGTVRCLPRRGEGQPCYSGGPLCEPGLECLPIDDESSECSTFRYAEPGDDCGNGFVCEAGSICVRVDNSDAPFRCVELTSHGGECHGVGAGNCPIREYCPLTNDDHAAGVFTATCQGQKEVGEPCGSPAECPEFTFCSACDVCEPRVAAGAPCREDWGCWSNRCIDGICAPLGVPEGCL